MAYDNDPYENIRDQPEFCDDCTLGEDCSLRGPCGAFELLYPLGETGLVEQLSETKNTIHLLRRLVEDWLTQIGMNIHFRQMFYQIVGEPYPDWFEVPKPDLYERQWVEENSILVREEQA